MTSRHSRRTLLRAIAAVCTLPAFALRASPAGDASTIALRALEQRAGGRLGVAAGDSGGRIVAYRAHERFPMCSTFKLMLCAAVMADTGAHRPPADSTTAGILARRIRIEKRHLVTYSPIVERRIGEEMSAADLCDAAIRYSDNAAANLLLAMIGGPPGFTAYARSIGDSATRLDRLEPALNSALPGDARDTTTPAAMRDSLTRMVLDDAQAGATREQLKAWMIGNTTGDKRIRAGAPSGWIVGDKTGTGANGATNDIAILWPPARTPIVLAIYSVGGKGSQPDRDSVVAQAARIAIAALA